MHVADVKQVLRVFSIEVPAREKDDLKEDPIVVKLRKVSVVRSDVQISMLIYLRLAVRAMTVFNCSKYRFVSLCILLSGHLGFLDFLQA